MRAALAFPTWADRRLLALAVAEERIIVTQDSDFSDLIYAFGEPPPPAIIYLRCEPEDEVDLAARVLEVLASDLVNAHMAVITAKATRFRPLPDKSNEND